MRKPRRYTKRSLSTLTLAQAKSLIKSTNGMLFGVTFKTKKDDNLRNMACRLGVRKGLSENSDPMKRLMEDAENNVMTVFDFNAEYEANDKKGAYRRINLNTLQRFQFGGIIHLVNSEQ